MEKETDFNQTNPFEAWERQPGELSPELVTWAKESYSRKLLSLYSIFNTPELVVKYREFKLRKFVAKHERGHARVAAKLGWRVLEFVINGTGRALGWVRLAPPDRPVQEWYKDLIPISAGGEAATGSSWGCSSDHVQAEAVSASLGERVNGIDLASCYLPEDSILDDEAKEDAYALMAAA